MSKPKVLLIQEYIPHYRMPIFNMLADYVDLTVIYSEGELPPNARFTPLYIPKRTIPINLLVKRTTVIVSKKSYYKIAKDFDVVICIAYYRWLDMIMLESLPHKYKLIYWGIGVAASYGVPYDSSIPFAKETFKHAQKVDAMLFYSDYPVKKYASMGLNPQKMFVANNTVQVASLPYTSEGRNSILFIGTLYKEKNVNELIKAYSIAYQHNENIPDLIIIGDGDERSFLEKLVRDSGLHHKVSFVGKITDDLVLQDYFSKSLLCISPSQAGLSVLKSMGYGVPYVTHKEAITGGEIFNIHNGIDGILLEDFSDLVDIIGRCATSPEWYLRLGKSAYDFYHEFRLPQNMVQGFLDAINYVLDTDDERP